METRRRTRGFSVLLLVAAVSACASRGIAPEPTIATTTTSGSWASATSTPSKSSTSTATTVPPTTSTTTTTLPPLDPPTYESVANTNTIREFAGYTARGLTRWVRSVPGIEDIRITSTLDGAEQPALWLAPTGERDQPLLVILHSWSAPYTQHAGIPYAMWAQENGWAVIAPNFRGVNVGPDSVGSELAVQDVVDAIDYATSQDSVDAARVFTVGYSGGGMMSLLLAGRHPDKVTAVAAWGPTYDLIDFYAQSRAAGRHYATDISRACGGDPRAGGPAQVECLRRSPMSYLDLARENGVPVYIGQGIYDSFVSPTQGARAFNHLADPEDRFTDEELEVLARRRLPEHLLDSNTTESFFEDGDPIPVFARHSAAVWLVYFRGDHEMAYLATLRWFASDPH